jgi:hypothetical protein
LQKAAHISDSVYIEAEKSRDDLAGFVQHTVLPYFRNAHQRHMSYSVRVSA